MGTGSAVKGQLPGDLKKSSLSGVGGLQTSWNILAPLSGIFIKSSFVFIFSFIYII